MSDYRFGFEPPTPDCPPQPEEVVPDRFKGDCPGSNLDRFMKFNVLSVALQVAWTRDCSDHELSLGIRPFLQKIEIDGHEPGSIPDYEREIYDQLAPLSAKDLLLVCQQLMNQLVASDRTCKEEEQQFNAIKKSISALSDRERNDLYILFLIADREGWGFWKTNQEMGYFPPDHPLIEAIDRASRSPAQWLHFFYVFGGKSVEEDAIATA